LVFLVKFSSYLGFMPASGNQLLEFCSTVNFAVSENDLLNLILLAEFDDEIKMEGFIRKKILNLLLKFYSLNIEGMDTIFSAKILSEILSK
jgi:DNA repair protein RecO (recombination protein O)